MTTVVGSGAVFLNLKILDRAFGALGVDKTATLWHSRVKFSTQPTFEKGETMVTLSYIESILLPKLHGIQRAAGVDTKRPKTDISHENGYTKVFKDSRLELIIRFEYEPLSLRGDSENFRTEIAAYFLGEVGKNGVVYFRRANIRKKAWRIEFVSYNDPNMAVGRLAKELGVLADVDIVTNESRAMVVLAKVCDYIRARRRLTKP